MNNERGRLVYSGNISYAHEYKGDIMLFWPKELPDLLEKSGTAYDEKISAQEYEAEKGLLELYRTFVIEILRISLAGVAVLGFLTKLKNGVLNDPSKYIGATSTLFFAVSSILALVFLYASANGYRCYIAGLRAKAANIRSDYDADYYLCVREKMLKSCRWSKFLATVFLALGALTAMIAIWSIFFDWQF